jgi:hypothetical protein
MCNAEFQQFFYRGRIPTEEEYITISKGKTAALFATIMESIATELQIYSKIPRSLGELFGIYFQIKNDMDKYSSEIDKKNEIYTIKDILGIEKTYYLLDNYRNDMRNLIREIPENMYKQELEDLFKE